MGAFAAIVHALIGSPLPLPEELLVRYPELRAVRFRRGGLPPRVGGWALGVPSVAAIALWRTVYLASATRIEPALLLHELRHVHQFQDDRAFPLRYLWESLRRGYRNNRFEIDANRYAAHRLRGQSVQPHREDV